MNATIDQTALFSAPIETRVPPTTRYQGSKLKLADWIWDSISDLEFHSALDAFSGTSTIAYLLKSRGKAVTANDHLRCNTEIARALVENDGATLDPADAETLFEREPGRSYDTVVEDLYHDTFFTDDENRWIDVVAQNIAAMPDRMQRSLAYFALFQACIAKRPYNLFHRKNLYMRTAQVERSFGNKATWDKPFPEHFLAHLAEANRAAFAGSPPCAATCLDAREVPGSFDLVYMDPPYTNGRGTAVDYADFYHFLEGLTRYDEWRSNVDSRRKHRPFIGPSSDWSRKDVLEDAFSQLFAAYADSTLVLSYRSDGMPSEQRLVELMREHKADVRVLHYGEYQYVLSKNSRSRELLIIGR